VGSLDLIAKIAGKIAPGRAPSFIEVHVIKALEVIGSGEAVGRIRLSKMLGLGEGEARTLVKHLKNEGLIEVSRSGIVLSKFGEEVFTDLRSQIGKEVEVPESSLTVGPFNTAILVRNMAHIVRHGVEQRDAAIRVSASGATTLIFRNKRLIIPGVGEDILREVPTIQDLLVSSLKPGENDVIIIGSANDKQTAELGAKMAAFKLLKSKER